MALIIIGIILVLTIIIGPTIWVSYVLNAHDKPRSDFPGTGGEFARHLLDLADLQEVAVEITDQGDHYDPQDKAVRLDKKYYQGKTLTAVVVAAHEVGHALQDRNNYQPLRLRTQLAHIAHYSEMAAMGVVMLSPLTTFLSPRFLILHAAAFVIIMASRVVLHLITLPVEFDASFARAMPILDKGNYLPKTDLPQARSILKACAWTYVAATLVSIIDIIRWFRFIR